MSQALTPTSKPCLYYPRGACKEGSACRFSHVDGRTLQRTSTPSSTQPRTTTPGVCSFWQQRRCTKGDACAYSHSDTTQDRTSWRTSASITASVIEPPNPPTARNSAWAAGWSPKLPCKYWQEGRCSKGDACTFGHENVAASAAETAVPGIESFPVSAYLWQIIIT